MQNTISLLTPFGAYLLAEEPSQWAWEQLGLPGEFVVDDPRTLPEVVRRLISAHGQPLDGCVNLYKVA